LIRGFTHVTAAQRDARREVWHIFVHPACACDWLQPHWQPAGAARRSIPGVSATDPTTAVNASPSAKAQRSEKRAAISDGTLPYIIEFSLVSPQKPMDHQAK
jgi:hypothetical protein